MKKYFFSIIAVMLAVVFSSYTSNSGKQSNLADTDWYQVDHTTQNTISSTPLLSNMTKTEAIDAQDCKNTGTLFCLVGSSSSVAQGTPASNFSDANRVKEN